MVYIREWEVEKVFQSLLSLNDEKKYLLLNDYRELQKIQSDYAKEIKPLENKIKKLEEKINQKRTTVSQYRRSYMCRHLKQLDLPVSKMEKFVHDSFTILEEQIRLLAFKKEEEK